jgi:4'-phosphopantetheinyl transferase
MWVLPPRQLLLEQGSLHIWRASLALSAEERERLEGVLSAEERDQCGRFVRPADRARCTASRASLRVVLAKYLLKDPRMLSFSAGPSGKPSLDRADPSIQFNISHAGDLALIAVTRGLRVGIDVERVREVPDMEAILYGFFSEQETAWLRSREGEERTRAFFLLWTRREAAAKALGIGLFDCFARFVLPLSARARSGFRVALPDPAPRYGVFPERVLPYSADSAPRYSADSPDTPAGPARDWWMRDLLPAPGYAGAVCIEQKNAKPLLWRLQYG